MSTVFQFESKARTLSKLKSQLDQFQIPALVHFQVGEWKSDPDQVLDEIRGRFGSHRLIVRSSARDEDGEGFAMAGQYDSVLDVDPTDPDGLETAISVVVQSYDREGRQTNDLDEIIVQEMLSDTVMSGVLFTHDLNTGAPYYVINYDDESGRTDTVTAGDGVSANRTLYAHRGAHSALHSPRFIALLEAVKELEVATGSQFLDVEFAMDSSLTPFLLQVRHISTQANWNRAVAHQVEAALEGVHRLMASRLGELPGALGSRSVLGQMPDWNPAEMIGRAPRQLALSLYQTLITDRAWVEARRELGYATPEGHPLMLVLAGQPFIDVRLSFHSYLPDSLPPAIGARLVDYWLDRLEANPHLHDKVEFDVAMTSFVFDSEEEVARLIPGVLTEEDERVFIECLRDLTRELIKGPSLESSLQRTNKLHRLNSDRHLNALQASPSLIGSLIAQCLRLGTIPFSIQARHGFVARSLLLSLVRTGVLTTEEAERFSQSIRTVAAELVEDLRMYAGGTMDADTFLSRYGHLRPGTYDILSPRYDQTPNLLDGVKADSGASNLASPTPLSDDKLKEIELRLAEAGLPEVGAAELMEYIRRATAAREYGKFVFTRTLSDILELVAALGESWGLSRDEISHIPIDELLKLGVESLPEDPETFLRRRADRGRDAHSVAIATRLPQLLHDLDGIHVVPFQVSHPNFITQKSVRAPSVALTTSLEGQQVELENRIILIENADPGYDWIFAHGISGLVTKFGGANSHMAIRCAEFGIPAAIGCGEQIFDRLSRASAIELRCGEGQVRPVRPS